MYLREIGEISAKSPSFRRKLDTAKNIVRKALSQYKYPYVAMSGGKDSMAMLGVVDDVAAEMGVDFEVFSHLSDASFPGTEEAIVEAVDKLGRKAVLDWSPVSAFEVMGRPGSWSHLGKKGFFFEGIKNYAASAGRDLAFVGVRASESHRRRRAIRIHGSIFKTKTPSPITVCYPLAWFDIKDVAAAIVHYGLPIHPIYGKNPIGEDPLNIRLGYATAKDLLSYGTAVFIKVNYPDTYKKMVNYWPEIRQYT